MKLRHLITTIAIFVASIVGITLPAQQASAHNGYYRGYTCYSGVCGNVYAWSYSTPTYGHMHGWGQCMTVRIERDFGNYVSVTKAGYWGPC